MNTSSTELKNASIGGNETFSHMNHFDLPLTTITFTLCVIGLIGNGIVIWFLSLKMKRNQFTIYVLNLAAADFIFLSGFSTFLVYMICVVGGLKKSIAVETYVLSITGLLYNLGFNAGIYLLTAIGLERCLAVLYPFWHQCKRPKNLSVYVCTGLWMLAALVTGLECFMCLGGKPYRTPGSERCTNVYYFTSALYTIVVLTMLVSSVTLLIDIQKASKHCHPPKLYIAIVASVAVFLISVVPARILGFLYYFNILDSEAYLIIFYYVTSICSAFNSSANPYIYLLVGRCGMNKSEEGSIKHILVRVFKDDAESQSMEHS
ncbi:proto-oncogene Mas-like [Discoglossus pictus]